MSTVKHESLFDETERITLLWRATGWEDRPGPHRDGSRIGYTLYVARSKEDGLGWSLEAERVTGNRGAMGLAVSPALFQLAEQHRAVFHNNSLQVRCSPTTSVDAATDEALAFVKAAFPDVTFVKKRTVYEYRRAQAHVRIEEDEGIVGWTVEIETCSLQGPTHRAVGHAETYAEAQARVEHAHACLLLIDAPRKPSSPRRETA